jgi:hypothetical protein
VGDNDGEEVDPKAMVARFADPFTSPEVEEFVENATTTEGQEDEEEDAATAGPAFAESYKKQKMMKKGKRKFDAPAAASPLKDVIQQQSIPSVTTINKSPQPQKKRKVVKF